MTSTHIENANTALTFESTGANVRVIDTTLTASRLDYCIDCASTPPITNSRGTTAGCRSDLQRSFRRAVRLPRT